MASDTPAHCRDLGDVAILRAVMRRKISENLKRVKQRIEQACLRAGRKPESVKLVAVTKYATLDVVRTMVDLGFENLGESAGFLFEHAADRRT